LSRWQYCNAYEEHSAAGTEATATKVLVSTEFAVHDQGTDTGDDLGANAEI
jgi:hypothetical protein